MSSYAISVTVDGQVQTASVQPRMLLCDFLRDELAVTSVLVGCEQGVCGACNVAIDGVVQRSCTVFAVQADGSEIETAASLAGEHGSLDPLQEALREHHGLQCGFCTPGMLLTIRDILARHSAPSESTIRKELSGNLCRCTGYVNIVRAVQAMSLPPKEVERA